MKVLAFDFGASSGRAILGIYENGKLEMQEMHRFSNDPVMVNGTFYWDALRLFFEIKQGILKCVNAGHKDIESIAIDTWGVDFALLDKDGKLLENPVNYRDLRTEGMQELFYENVMSKDELYAETGIQFANLNTLFQLYSLKVKRPEMLEKAETLLFMPDLFAYFLTGKKGIEYTIASTSQLLDAKKRDWNFKIVDKMGLKRSLFTEIQKPGTVRGTLLPEIAEELGIDHPVDVIACTSHDTASAFVASPIEKNDNSCSISCGTWSLLGAELPDPIISDITVRENFTNEGGYNNTIRFLKNISGLWLIQETRRQWNREGNNISFKDIDNMIAVDKSADVYINPESEEFLAPGNMPKRIAAALERTGQKTPETKAQYAICILESLALTYRYYIENLEKVLGHRIETIHLIGGGTQDHNLCQYTANATNRKVTAGPIEATALGNIAVQLISRKAIADVDTARTMLGDLIIYKPQNAAEWDKKYEEYLKVKKNA